MPWDDAFDTMAWDDGAGGGVTGGVSGVALTVEAAFSTTNPLTTPISWTSLAGYIRGLSIRRGKQHELARTQAGECTITLDNRDGRFDPTNGGSPYNPNVVPMRRIRVRATQNAVTYNLFEGYVENWGQSYPVTLAGGGDTECNVRAVDAFKLLSLFDLSGYSAEVQTDGPVNYWKLEDAPARTLAPSAGSLSFAQADGGAVGTIAGPFAHGGQVGVTFNGSQDYTTGTDVLSLTGPLSVEFWLRPGASSGTARTVVDSWPTFHVRLTNNVISFSQVGIGGQDLFATATLADFVWSHVVITRDVSSAVRFFVNGVEATPTDNKLHLTAETGQDVSLALGIGTDANYIGSIAHLAIYDRVLSPERIAIHTAATFDTFIEQDSGSHIDTLLDVVGWPSGERDIDIPGLATIQAIVPSGNALDWCLRVAEDSEGGIFQADAAGVLNFHSRNDLLGTAHNTSLATFGDGGGAEIPYSDLAARYDDQDLYSEIEVPRDNGILQIASDAASALAYGPRTLTRPSQLVSTDGQALDDAMFRLALYKAPHLRVDSVTFIGVSNTPTTTWEQMLGRATHFDRVTAKRRPTGGNTITQASNIEGVNHDVDFDANQWKTVFLLTPADLLTYWILGDTTYSVLDSTTRLGP
jgi:hypothetical protein